MALQSPSPLSLAQVTCTGIPLFFQATNHATAKFTVKKLQAYNQIYEHSFSFAELKFIVMSSEAEVILVIN
jgi:hypothetical protein